jgi:quinol-cytochrome oxidoreductase complex cytochrome b subunit
MTQSSNTEVKKSYKQLLSELIQFLKELIVNVYRSIFRYGKLPTDQEGQSFAIFNNLFLHIHSVKVSRHALSFTYTFGLGIICAIFFGALTFTGIWLMFYYIPSSEEAYNRMLDLRASVDFGFVLRNVHKWAAELMVLFVILHMARVFFTGGYKPPREFNWVVGVILLVLTLGLSFTGYLLPWDQLAFWAITVGTAIAGYVPVYGQTIREFMLGGDVVGQEALIRFYVLHVVLLPFVLVLLLAIHIWRIRKDGGISHPRENEPVKIGDAS